MHGLQRLAGLTVDTAHAPLCQELAALRRCRHLEGVVVDVHMHGLQPPLPRHACILLRPLELVCNVVRCENGLLPEIAEAVPTLVQGVSVNPP